MPMDDEKQTDRVQKIPITQLVPFKDHPFKVVEDESMLRTTESISMFGVLTPLIARPTEDGKEFMRITVPNQDPADKTPWASFVLPAKAVHENQYSKGLWAKIPADGKTTMTKPTLMGQDEAGKNIWQDVKTDVPNRDLKAMVESYKTRAPQEKGCRAQRICKG